MCKLHLHKLVLLQVERNENAFQKATAAVCVGENAPPRLHLEETRLLEKKISTSCNSLAFLRPINKVVILSR